MDKKHSFVTTYNKKEEILIRNLLTAIALFTAVYILVTNRYRVINRIFKYQLLRRTIIHLALKLPFVRDKLYSIVFHNDQVPRMD
ncbi:hypothetical protein [Alkalicoccobacillus porphyridii]|uniref:Uncharacterized protein n=1 Tax=Alkalicoccobacillus porphyridii TaxID=2597270 RepID=A0A553ZZ45_9BACI|nr:hypothetical protein [Alkalicoccobacillus porphyridii]TSB46713.1 hypothetical protein FN960_10180 [Alkalicoccobacillus porphyridii]